MFRNPYADGLIVLVILLLFFGPKRLPLLGRSLGQGLREFKQSITGESSGDLDDERPEIPKSSAPSEPSAGGTTEAPPQPAGTPADRAG
jgi:sec-independent protein translocase protein TatA